MTGQIITKAISFEVSSNQTNSFDPSLTNFDIRIDKSKASSETIDKFRRETGKSSLEIENERLSVLFAESDLKKRIPTLVAEYDKSLHIPEVISTSVKDRIAFSYAIVFFETLGYFA